MEKSCTPPEVVRGAGILQRPEAALRNGCPAALVACTAPRWCGARQAASPGLEALSTGETPRGAKGASATEGRTPEARLLRFARPGTTGARSAAAGGETLGSPEASQFRATSMPVRQAAATRPKPGRETVLRRCGGIGTFTPIAGSARPRQQRRNAALWARMHSRSCHIAARYPGPSLSRHAPKPGSHALCRCLPGCSSGSRAALAALRRAAAEPSRTAAPLHPERPRLPKPHGALNGPSRHGAAAMPLAPLRAPGALGRAVLGPRKGAARAEGYLGHVGAPWTACGGSRAADTQRHLGPLEPVRAEHHLGPWSDYGGSPGKQAAQQAHASTTRETRTKRTPATATAGQLGAGSRPKRQRPRETPSAARNAALGDSGRGEMPLPGAPAGRGGANWHCQGRSFRRDANSDATGTARNTGSASAPRVPSPAQNAAGQSGAGPGAPRREGPFPGTARIRARSAPRRHFARGRAHRGARAKLHPRETPPRETFRPSRR